VISFLQAFRLKHLIDFSSPLCVLHVSPIPIWCYFLYIKCRRVELYHIPGCCTAAVLSRLPSCNVHVSETYRIRNISAVHVLLSGRHNSHDQEVPSCCRARRLIAVTTTARHYTLSRNIPLHFTSETSFLLLKLYGSDFIACSISELNFFELYESVTFDKTSWTSDQPVARSLPTQDNTTQKQTYKT
jgi:hypothetical protein